MADWNPLITLVLALVVLLAALRLAPRPFTLWRRVGRGWISRPRLVVRNGRVL